MKIVFIGTPEFATPSLSLLNQNYKIPLVITRPDKPKGRGKKVLYSEVKKLAEELNIKVLQPTSINEKAIIDELIAIKPDLFVVVAFGQILTKKVLNIPKFGAINLHASILPKYRGPSPIQQAIIDGEKTTGVTTMLMDEKMDTGDILLQKKIEIEEEDNYITLSEKLSKIGAKLLIETVTKIKNQTIKREKQDNNLSTYCKIFKKEDGNINWNKCAKEIENFVKGINPWPGAYTFINDKKFKIFEVKNTKIKTDGKIGKIAFLEKDKLYINAKDFMVAILKIQSSSGKILTIKNFLAGNLKYLCT